MYNAYIPGPEPYRKPPEQDAPGAGGSPGEGRKPGGAPLLSLLGGLTGKLGGLDTGDLLLLALVFLLLREGESTDWVLLLALAAVLLSDEG